MITTKGKDRMDFLNWLKTEIDDVDKRLERLPHYSPEWIMYTHRISVLEECYRRYKNLHRTQG